MSSSDRIRRLLPISERSVHVGSGRGRTAISLDSRPLSIQEAETRCALQLVDLQERHQSALETAYQNGYNDGQSMAGAHLSTERERVTLQFESMFAELARTRHEWFATCEKQMVELVCRALEQILGDRPPVASRITHALRRAVEGLIEADRLTVRCHPGDLKFLQEATTRTPDSWVGSRQIRLIADEDVRPNGCLVETTLGVVDARVEQQLAILRGALFDALSEAGVTEGSADVAPDGGIA